METLETQKKSITSRISLPLDVKRIVLVLALIISATLFYTVSRWKAATVVADLVGSSADLFLQVTLSLFLVLLTLASMIVITSKLIGESLISPPPFTPIQSLEKHSTVKIFIVFSLFTFACPVLIISVLTPFSFYPFVQTQKNILFDLISPKDPISTSISLTVIVIFLGPFLEELIFRVFNGYWLEQAELSFTVKISIVSGLFWTMHFLFPFNPLFVVPWMIEVFFGAYLFYFLYRAQGQTNPTYLILLPLGAHLLVNGLDVLLVLLDLYVLNSPLVEILAVIIALSFLMSSGILFRQWQMQGIFTPLFQGQTRQQIRRSMIIFAVTVLGFQLLVILIRAVIMTGLILSMLVYLILIAIMLISATRLFNVPMKKLLLYMVLTYTIFFSLIILL